MRIIDRWWDWQRADLSRALLIARAFGPAILVKFNEATDREARIGAYIVSCEGSEWQLYDYRDPQVPLDDFDTADEAVCDAVARATCDMLRDVMLKLAPPAAHAAVEVG